MSLQGTWTEVQKVCPAVSTLEFNDPNDSSLRITDLILLCTEMEAPTDQNLAEHLADDLAGNKSDEIESCHSDGIIGDEVNDSHITENSSSEEHTHNPRGSNH